MKTIVYFLLPVIDRIIDLLPRKQQVLSYLWILDNLCGGVDLQRLDRGLVSAGFKRLPIRHVAKGYVRTYVNDMDSEISITVVMK